MVDKGSNTVYLSIFVATYVCLSIYLLVYHVIWLLSVYLYLSLAIVFFLSLAICFFLCIYTYLFVYIFICLYLSACTLIYWSVFCQSVCQCMYVSLYIYFHSCSLEPPQGYELKHPNLFLFIHCISGYSNASPAPPSIILIHSFTCPSPHTILQTHTVLFIKKKLV